MKGGRGKFVRGSCGLVVRVLAASLAVSVAAASAQTVTWRGAGASGVWSDAANWSAAVPTTGGSLVFSGTTLTSSTNNAASVASAAGLSFANNGSLGFTSGFSLAGDTISLTGVDSLTTARAFSSTVVSDTIGLALTLDGAGGTNRVTANALHNLTLSGNLSGTGELVKLGTGTVTLSGNNTNSGATSLLAGGLVLDYATNNTSKLADSAALTLGSGVLTLSGGSHTEAVGSTSLVGGAAINRSSGSATLQLGAITRNAGGRLYLASGTIAKTTNGNTGGILGGWAVVGNNWAVAGTSGTLVGLVSYTTLPTSGFSGTTNYNVSANTTLSSGASGSLNSLRVNTTNLTLSSNVLTIESGGIIGIGDRNIIGTGTITAGANSGYELFAWQGNSSGQFTFAGTVSIADNGANPVGVTVGVVPGSAGDVTFNGTSNTYSGPTRIMQGALGVSTISNGNAIGTLGQSSAAASNLVLDGGGLRVNSGNQSTDRLFTLGVGGGFLFANAGSLAFSNTGAVAFSGSGARTFTLQTNSAAGHTGTFRPLLGDGLGGATSLVRTGAGTWTVTNANTYTGPTVIASSSSTLAVASLANGGLASSIGQSSADAGNLVFDNGVLQISPTTTTVQSTDRLFTMGTGGAILDSSGGAGSSMVFTGTGALAFVNDGARTLTLQGIRTGTFAPQVGDGSGGATSLVKSGTGSWTLTGSNTFTGTTSVNAGTLTLGNVNALRGSTLSGSVAFMAGSNTFNLGGLSGTANLGLGTNSLTVGWNGQSTTYSGALSGATSGFTKAGSGGLTLSAAHTYGGDTVIAGGTLALGSGGSFASSPRIVVGNAGSSGAVLDLTAKTSGFTFASTQTVQGSGTIRIPGGQAITISGTLSPGNSPGTLTIADGDLVLGASSLTLYEINGTDATVGGGINDLTSVSGSLTLGGTLNVSATPAFDVFGSRSYRVFDYRTSGTGSLAGSMAIGTTPSTDFLYSLDTATLGQVSLFVQRKAEQAATLAYGQPTSGTVSAFANTNVTFTGTLTNFTPSGGVALGVSLADGGGQLTVGSLSASSGTSVAAGSSATISGTIASGATLGARTWSVVNTDASALNSTTSTASGVVNVLAHGTPVLSGSSIDFGYVLVGSATTRGITVSNGTLGSPAADTGGITWTSGSLPSGFAGGGANSVGVIASGSGTSYSYSLATGSAGFASGSQAFAFADDASVLGSGVLGSLSLLLTGTVLDPATAILTGGVTSGTTWTINLGSQNQGTGDYTQGFSISNLLQTSGYTADLRLLSFTPAPGNGSEIGITLTGTNDFSPLVAGSGSNAYLASLGLASAEGAFTNSYTLSFGSFKNGSWLGDTQNVSLTVTGTIIAVPEPTALALAGCGLGAALWMRRRRKRVSA